MRELPVKQFLRSLLVFVLATGVVAAAPVPIIFDTDMDSDCDDAAALAMLHALADRGETEILATLVSSYHEWSAPCVDAINTYYGRGNLPVGVPKGARPEWQSSHYAQEIAEEFPHDVVSREAARDATEVYRQVLAGQADRSVVIVTVGDLTNLRYLLESAGDQYSPLSGVELVQKKVERWVCMGSRYPADLDPGRWGNFKLDPESTVKAVRDWPTPIVFTGGGAFAEAVATGRCLAELAANNPVRRVYELYFRGVPEDRHSADQIAVLVAVRGTGAPWRLVSGGHNHIFADGRHEWRETPDNTRHSYISALAAGASPREVTATLETLMNAPPTRLSAR